MQRILTGKHDSCRHQLQTTLPDHTLNHQSIDLISFKSLVQSEVYCKHAQYNYTRKHS